MFLFLYNLTSPSSHRIEANILNDCISSYHAKFDNKALNSFSISEKLNLKDVWWATIIGHSDFYNHLLLQSQQIISDPVVFEPIYKFGSTLDVFFTSDSELISVYVDSVLCSDHYRVSALFNLPICYSESATNMTTNYLFSSTRFNSKLSTGFNTLMALQNFSFSEPSMEFFSQYGNKQWWTTLTCSAKAKLLIHYSFDNSLLPIQFNWSINFVKIKSKTIEKVPLKNYNKKLLCLLTETKQSLMKNCPLTPLVPALSFYNPFRQNACHFNATGKTWKHTSATKVLISLATVLVLSLENI